MRRLAVVLAVMLLVPACGGGGNDGAQPSAPPAARPEQPPDPGRETIETLIAGAREDDVGTLWGMLSRRSQRRVGPTLEDFRKGAARQLQDGLGAFVPGRYRVIVSELVTAQIGVVAVAGRRRLDGGEAFGAYALPLRWEGERLRAVLGARLRIEIIAPMPGVQTEPLAQIAVRIKGGARVPAEAVLWLDGQMVAGRGYGTAAAATVFANLDKALPSGRHTVVAFVHTGDDAAALGWAFTVPR